MSLQSSEETVAKYIQYHTLNYCQEASRLPYLAKMIKVDVWKFTIECSVQVYIFNQLSQDCNLPILLVLVKWYVKGDHSLRHKQIISVDYSSDDLAFQWILKSLVVSRETLSE